MNIDLHWWLNNSPLHHSSSGLTLESLWAAAKPGNWRGIPVLFPSIEDAVLLNSMHMSYEHWFQRLRFFLDQQKIVERVDVERLLVRAQELGMERLLATSLLFTEAVTGKALNPKLKQSSSIQTHIRSHHASESDLKARAYSLFKQPHPMTRFKQWAIKRRLSTGRFLAKAEECARILDLTDTRYASELRRALLLPSAPLLRRLYVTENPWASRVLHPLAIGIGFLTKPAPMATRRRRLFD